MVSKGYKKLMILENLKQYVFLVMKLEIILLICIWQMMNKTIWQSTVKNLNLKQNHKIIIIKKKVKENIINSAVAPLKGRKIVFKAFESIFISKV